MDTKTIFAFLCVVFYAFCIGGLTAVILGAIPDKWWLLFGVAGLAAFGFPFIRQQWRYLNYKEGK